MSQFYMVGSFKPMVKPEVKRMTVEPMCKVINGWTGPPVRSGQVLTTPI